MSTTTEHAVSGMSCAHCVDAVTDEVGAIPGVTSVEVDLSSGLVRVTGDQPVDPDAFAAAIDEAGFEVASP